MSRMTLGSLFAGSGSFEFAGQICGITPKWNAEIEPYPCKVLAARFPDVPNLGDVTQIDGAKIEPVDIVTGGVSVYRPFHSWNPRRNQRSQLLSLLRDDPNHQRNESRYELPVSTVRPVGKRAGCIDQSQRSRFS